MTPEKIHGILDKMLENQKSRNFLNHLVKAYFPVSNIEKVFEKPTRDFKCVLTRESLISVQEIMEGVHSEEFKNNFIEHLKTIFDENSNKKNPMQELLGDKKLGFTGKNTTTFMSFTSLTAFQDWLMTKMLTGDKHINWLVNNIRRESGNFIATRTSKQAVQKVNDKTATFKIGEANDVLAKLKEKMLKEGK